MIGERIIGADNIGYGDDPYPNPGFIPDDFTFLSSTPNTQNYDPYLPILQEPMGRDFNRKNIVSSLNSVTPYGYQASTLGLPEEKYYPSDMTTPQGRPEQGGDTRVDNQYERFGGGPNGQTWWLPDYTELMWMFIILLILLVLISFTKEKKIAKLKQKLALFEGGLASSDL